MNLRVYICVFALSDSCYKNTETEKYQRYSFVRNLHFGLSFLDTTVEKMNNNNKKALGNKLTALSINSGFMGRIKTGVIFSWLLISYVYYRINNNSS